MLSEKFLQHFGFKDKDDFHSVIKAGHDQARRLKILATIGDRNDSWAGSGYCCGAAELTRGRMNENTFEQWAALTLHALTRRNFLIYNCESPFTTLIDILKEIGFVELARWHNASSLQHVVTMGLMYEPHKETKKETPPNKVEKERKKVA